MPRKLVFKIGKREYETFPERIDRRKLYGWTELTATDEEGIPCGLLSSDESGRNIIPPRGTAAGILSDTGRWIERAQLRVIDTDGKTPRMHRSNFNRVNRLTAEASAEEFLDHTITDFYYLDGAPEDMAETVGDRIFRIDFSYNDSYDPSPAFILASAGRMFLLAGIKNRYRMLCFGECESPAYETEEEFEDEREEEDIDFTMF